MTKLRTLDLTLSPARDEGDARGEIDPEVAANLLTILARRELPNCSLPGT